MLPYYLLRHLGKALLQRILVLYVQPEYSRVAVLVPFRIRNSKLSFANSSKAVKNNGATTAVAAKCLLHFRKLFLSCYKVFDFGNIGEAEGN